MGGGPCRQGAPDQLQIFYLADLFGVGLET